MLLVRRRKYYLDFLRRIPKAIARLKKNQMVAMIRLERDVLKRLPSKTDT